MQADSNNIIMVTVPSSAVETGLSLFTLNNNKRVCVSLLSRIAHTQA